LTRKEHFKCILLARKELKEMRCKCCDAWNAVFILGDWYCEECSDAILEVIQEDEPEEEEEEE
jgi:hypothetical protein